MGETNSGVLWWFETCSYKFTTNAELENLVPIYYLWYLKFKHKYSQMLIAKQFILNFIFWRPTWVGML